MNQTTVRIVKYVPILLAAAICVILASGHVGRDKGKTMADPIDREITRGDIPPIDTRQPLHVETATFAMG